MLRRQGSEKMWFIVEDPSNKAPWLMFNMLFVRINFERGAFKTNESSSDKQLDNVIDL